MAIKLSSLQKPTVTQSTFLYQDLKLDLAFDYTQNNQFLKTSEIKDIQVDYDYAAIRNSIFNLFTTIPGQKVLNPVFGINLIQYLFRPVNTTTANDIGKAVLKGITTFEPRVSVVNINVSVDQGNNQFIIALTVKMPTISSSSFRLVGTLSNNGFIFNT